MILSHIHLDKSFIFFLLIIILTGNFNAFFFYFILLLIHEIGHALCGLFFGYKLDKITFYSYGGITNFNYPINIPLKRELLILIMGPVFQILGYLLLKNVYDIKLFHYTLLIFNLLPIYPLDGGRILNILCNYAFNYLKSFYLTFIISNILIILLFLYNLSHFNLNLLLMLGIIFIKLITFFKNRYYYYQRFLLERYLHEYSFTRVKIINNIKNFYRDRKHYIFYLEEKKYLKKYFKR